ncbi:hypothetical protein [Haloarcula amylovorans]|uniref:hypothetical protein n=1 Tax=Haloarcula amylovorans TaxID=2562280 RepID=UPI001075D2A5|nr:hypothetical protein [Halomicroarcula amylolytica]
MTDDDGPLGWVHWPTVLKAAVAGIGIGMILALVVQDFVFGVLFGLVNGVAFGIGRSYTRS